MAKYILICLALVLALQVLSTEATNPCGCGNENHKTVAGLLGVGPIAALNKKDTQCKSNYVYKNGCGCGRNKYPQYYQ